MNLKAYLKSRQEKIDRALDRHLPKENLKPTTIHKAMRYSLFAGGTKELQSLRKRDPNLPDCDII